MKKEMDIMDKLYKATASFLIPLGLKETYRVVVKEAKKLLGAEYGTIFIKRDGKFERAYSTVPLAMRVNPRKFGYNYKSYKSHKPLIIPRSKVVKAHPDIDERLKKYVIMPLSYRGKSVGTLTLHLKEDRYVSNKDYHALQLFSSLASLKIRNATLYEKLREVLSSRDLFINAAAHELRTPLTNIILYNQLVLNHVSNKKIPKRQWVKVISDQSNKLKTLINDFLQLEHIKFDQLRYQWSVGKLKTIIKQGITSIKIKYPLHKFEFKDLTADGGVVRGDFNKLLEVINNLLDNAAKFSSIKSALSVSLQPKKKYYLLTVTDKGKGIPPKNIPHLFKKYYKGDPQGKPGMGIGLYLSKQIVLKHRGKIKISSKLKKGTRAELLLPKYLRSQKTIDRE